MWIFKKRVEDRNFVACNTFQIQFTTETRTRKRINNFSNSRCVSVLYVHDTRYNEHRILIQSQLRCVCARACVYVAFESFACVFAQYTQHLLFDFVLIFIFCSVTMQRLLKHKILIHTGSLTRTRFSIDIYAQYHAYISFKWL